MLSKLEGENDNKLRSDALFGGRKLEKGIRSRGSNFGFKESLCLRKNGENSE